VGPRYDSVILRTLTGGPGKTVFRAGYSLSYLREGTSNFSSYLSATRADSLPPIAATRSAIW
jgi:hypothetical protein